MTFPNGPSRVSSATDPTTSSSGASGTPSATAACGHDMARKAQLLEKVFCARIFFHLHPAAPELIGGVRVGPCRAHLAELVGELRRRPVGRAIAPRVVGLDDVDAFSQLRNPLGTKV